MSKKEFIDLNVLILGLGSYKQGSGVSAARFFAKHGANVRVNDKKERFRLKENVKALNKFKNIEFIFGGHDTTLIDWADVVFQNPGVPDTHEMIKYAKKTKTPIINDWTLFFMHPKANCIGITGTRGKSTVTTLLHKMVLKKYRDSRLAGNIGLSPLQFIEEYDGELTVAELSSWLLRGLKEIKKSPSIAMVTNIYRDHQNMYPSMKPYIEDKKQIYLHQNASDTVILNHDNEFTRKMSNSAKGKVVWVGRKIKRGADGVYVKDGMIVARFSQKERSVIREGDFPIFGEHNVYNAMFAIAGAILLGVSKKDIVSALKEFKGVEFRLQHVGKYQGVDIYNDTTATTPDATIAALDAFAERRDVVLIAGGADKRLSYGKWARSVTKDTKSVVLLPGQATKKMVKALKNRGYQPIVVSDLAQAVSCGLSIAQKGDNLLFSPGAASFNQFANEFDRGEQFNKLIKSIK